MEVYSTAIWSEWHNIKIELSTRRNNLMRMFSQAAGKSGRKTSLGKNFLKLTIKYQDNLKTTDARLSDEDYIPLGSEARDTRAVLENILSQQEQVVFDLQRWSTVKRRLFDDLTSDEG